MTSTSIKLTLSLVAMLAMRPLAAAPAAPDKATDEAKVAIQAQYNRRNAAISRKDSEALWAIRTDDYVAVDMTGRKQYAAQLKPKEAKLFAMAKSLQGTSSVQTVTLRGNTASVVVNESGTVVLVNQRTKQESTLKLNGQYLDSWVKQNSAWRVAQSETLSATTTLDGRPVKP